MPPTGWSASTTRTGSRSATGIVKRLRAQRVVADAGAGPARGVRDSDRRRRTGSPPRSVGGSRPAPRHATTRSSSGPTATPIRSCGRSTWPASRGGSRGRPGCTPGPRSGCCWRSCAPSPTSNSSVDVYALAASEVYGLGGEDLTAIVNMARRRNRSVWAILEELDRQPGILRVAPETRATVHRLVADLRALRGGRPRADRPASCSTASCATAACSRGWSARTRRAAEEALQNIARFFEIVRAQSALLADDRAIFVAPPSRDAHRGGRRPGHGGARPRRRRGRGPDRPQGEGPRVPGRLPARAWSPAGSRRTGAGDPLALPAGLGRGEPTDRRSRPSPRSGGCATWR